MPGLGKRGLIILLVVLGLSGTGVFFSLRPAPLSVAVVAVDEGPVIASVSNTRAGTVDACRRAGLSPAFGGQMAVLPVNEGDSVNAGQVLLELWNKDLRAEVSLAERDAAAARARADEACVRSAVAKRESDRLARLVERKLTSEEAADRAAGDAEATAAACTAARTSARVSDAKLDVANATLERTILRAPFDGVIAEINGEVGEYVTPSPVGIATPPTVDLIDDSCLYISAPIDEVDAPAVRAGMPAVITLDAFPDQRFAGTVRRVAPYVLDQEKQARTVEIEAVIGERGDNPLLPGYSADVEVMLESRESVLRVPTQAIIDGSRVMILEPGDTLRERTVERGISNWEFTEITAGVDPGERVVLSVDREGVEDGASASAE